MRLLFRVKHFFSFLRGKKPSAIPWPGDTCTHQSEPILAMHNYGKTCSVCGYWCNISAVEFGKLFGKTMFKQAQKQKREFDRSIGKRRRR